MTVEQQKILDRLNYFGIGDLRQVLSEIPSTYDDCKIFIGNGEGFAAEVKHAGMATSNGERFLDENRGDERLIITSCK